MKSETTLPEATGALPVFGHALPLLRSPLKFLRGLPDQGDLVQLRLGPLRVLMICDPELTHSFLVQDRVFDKGGLLIERARQISGNGLFSCPSHEHRRQRRLVQPAFHHTRLPAYAQVMSERISAVMDSWSDGQILDVAKETHKITSRVLLTAMMGSSLSDDEFVAIEDDIDTLVNGMFLRMVLPEAVSRLPLARNRRFQEAGRPTRRILTEVIAKRRASEAETGDDLLSKLLVARDTEGDGDGMSETELIDQVVTFYGAGVETTATALTWALNMASRHPEVARALHEEARTAVAGTTATWDDLPGLTYTRDVLTETLRMYPPAWFLTRTTTSDTHLGKHVVPAGVTLAYSPYVIGHLPSLYDEPERFDPGRWSADAPHTPPRNAFVSFGGGARKCIGEEFSMTEATLVLATIMKRWRLHAQPGTGHQPKVSVALRPRALRLKVTALAVDGASAKAG